MTGTARCGFLLAALSAAMLFGARAASAEPVCDLFANNFDAPATGPCDSCFDGIVDFDESDVDCGGAFCRGCGVGLQCATGADCATGACSNGTCASIPLLISQVQTRGDNGSNDEFVELYNPGNAAVTFNSSWTVQARSAATIATCTSSTSNTRITGAGQVIPAHGHILFTNSLVPGYNGIVSGDATYGAGINDAASLVLRTGSTVVDALCFYFDATSQAALTGCSVPYTCEGTPAFNPHDNSSGTNTDASLERKPGGSLGNSQDTGDNSLDFLGNPASTPRNLSSPPAPSAAPEAAGNGSRER